MVLGKRSLPSGITYEGSFVNGELAEGTMTIPSLLTFKGVFENGSPKGGILTTANYTADGIFDETGSLVEGNILGSDKTFRTGHFEKCPTVLAGVQLLNGTIVREMDLRVQVAILRMDRPKKQLSVTMMVISRRVNLIEMNSIGVLLLMKVKST